MHAVRVSNRGRSFEVNSCTCHMMLNGSYAKNLMAPSAEDERVRGQPQTDTKVQQAVMTVSWQLKKSFFHCDGNFERAPHTRTERQARTHTRSQLHNHTPCWHLTVATLSPQTFPFNDYQASVSTSRMFFEGSVSLKRHTGPQQERPTSAISDCCRTPELGLIERFQVDTDPDCGVKPE